MAQYRFEYRGKEAIEMVISMFPNTWQEELKIRQIKIIQLSNRHGLSPIEAYKKFLMQALPAGETIIYFAALSRLVELSRLSSEEKSKKVNELELKRENVKNQIIALENSEIISYEDKKIIRSYYNRLQQETTEEINELINSFEVVEPKLIIHQPGLFDSKFNG